MRDNIHSVASIQESLAVFLFQTDDLLGVFPQGSRSAIVPGDYSVELRCLLRFEVSVPSQEGDGKRT